MNLKDLERFWMKEWSLQTLQSITGENSELLSWEKDVSIIVLTFLYFSFNIEQYICEFMMPSMICSSPTPAALMQPHIRTLPPPCFTVGTMYFSLYSSPLRRHTVLKPSVPKTFILVSSLQSIESQ